MPLVKIANQGLPPKRSNPFGLPNLSNSFWDGRALRARPDRIFNISHPGVLLAIFERYAYACLTLSRAAHALAATPARRSQPAAIAEADPGAGKSYTFEQFAVTSRGRLTTVRSFLVTPAVPSADTLFIDGLDETRGGPQRPGHGRQARGKAFHLWAEEGTYFVPRGV
jgi:hypothetical protein